MTTTEEIKFDTIEMILYHATSTNIILYFIKPQKKQVATLYLYEYIRFMTTMVT